MRLRLSPFALFLASLGSGWAYGDPGSSDGGPPGRPAKAPHASSRRPPVDEAAMQEAILSGHEAEDFASSASYAHYLRSRIAHDAGEHKVAIDELRLALVTDEANPFLVTELAEEYARLSELDRAERELRRVIEHTPTYQRAQLLMGRILLESQKFTRARFHLRKAIGLRPRDPDAYLVLTQLELELNRPEEAE